MMVWRYWKTAGGYRTCFTDFRNRRPVVRCTLTLRLSDKFPHHLVCLTPYRTLQLCCFGVQARRLLGQVCDSVLLLRRQAADRDILNVARVKMGYGGPIRGALREDSSERPMAQVGEQIARTNRVGSAIRMRSWEKKKLSSCLVARVTLPFSP